MGGAASAPSTQRILDALQSLTPAEVDRLEAAVRQERSGSASLNPGALNPGGTGASAAAAPQHGNAGNAARASGGGGGRARVS